MTSAASSHHAQGTRPDAPPTCSASSALAATGPALLTAKAISTSFGYAV
jgi:hypothetical protein